MFVLRRSGSVGNGSNRGGGSQERTNLRIEKVESDICVDRLFAAVGYHNVPEVGLPGWCNGQGVFAQHTAIVQWDLNSGSSYSFLACKTVVVV